MNGGYLIVLVNLLLVNLCYWLIVKVVVLGEIVFFINCDLKFLFFNCLGLSYDVKFIVVGDCM